MPRIAPPTPTIPIARIEPAGEHLVTDLRFEDLAALYIEHGALLLRGFAPDLSAFATLARRFCPTKVRNDSPGRVSISGDDTIQSVNLGGDAFPLHPELSREPWKPDAAFFACMQPPASGGETTLCDGIALAAALPDPIRRGLANRRLVHILPTWPGLFEYWLGTSAPDEAALANPPPSCPYEFRRTAEGSIVRLFSRPALHKPMFADGPAFGNFLLFARFHNGRGDFPLLDDLRPVPEDWLQAIHHTAERLTYAHTWQQGDVLILDNTRFMHGRRAIPDPAERHILTSFGYLGFAIPDPEEPRDPIWRRADFMPPLNPAIPRAPA